MKLNQFALSLVAPLLFAQMICASSTEKAFEITFSPGGSVYRLALNEERRLNEYQTKLRQQYGARGSDGNYIIIDHGNNEYSVLDHLKKKTFRFKRGERVKQGQVIAQVGQSGLSTEPHLHFEVVSDPDPLRQRGLPVSFNGLDGEEAGKVLHLGEIVRRAK